MNNEQIFQDAIKRLESIQSKLQDHLEENRILSNNFNILFQQNMEYFKEHYPAAYNELIKHTIHNKKVVCFENGEANLLDLRNGSLMYGDSPLEDTRRHVQAWLNGKNSYIRGNISFDPDPFCQSHFYYGHKICNAIDQFKEAHAEEPFLQDHDLVQEIPLLVINGGGLGYPIIELCSHIEPKYIYYIEPDLEIFLCSLGVIDWSGILEFLKNNHQQFYFLVGNDGLKSYQIYKYDFLYLYRALTVDQWIYSHYDSKDVDTFTKLLQRSTIEDFNSDGMFDDVIFGVNNTYNNCCQYAYADKNIDAKFKDLPIAIIANGPSLDRDLEFLKQHQNDFITVACGTALMSLENYGIIPDFYVAIERGEDVTKSLEFVKDPKIFEKTINLSLAVVPTTTFAKFKHNLMAKSGMEENIRSAASDQNKLKKELEPLISDRFTHPLVSNGAISIFASFEFNNYYLFGVDNGSINQDLTHSSYSHYYDPKVTAESDLNPLNKLSIDLPGNFVPSIKSNSLFLECKSVIEKTIDAHRNCAFYNCSNGALIEGATPLDRDQIKGLTALGTRKEQFKEELLKNAKRITINKDQYNKIYDQEKFNKFIDLLESLWNDPQKLKNRLDIVGQICSSYELFRNSVEEYPFSVKLTHGSINLYFCYLLLSLYIYRDQEISMKLSHSIVKIILEFLENCRYIFKNADKMIQPDHIKVLPHYIYENWLEEKKQEKLKREN